MTFEGTLLLGQGDFRFKQGNAEAMIRRSKDPIIVMTTMREYLGRIA